MYKKAFVGFDASFDKNQYVEYVWKKESAYRNNIEPFDIIFDGREDGGSGLHE